MSNLIDVSAITRKYTELLAKDPSLNGVNVDRGEYVNREEGRCPWVGVYRTEVDYAPRALGNHSRSWEALVTLKLVVQEHGKDGPNSEDALEKLIQRVLTVILGDLSIKQQVQMLRSLNIRYSYDETKSNTMDFQWAFITLIYETRTGI